MMLRYMKQIQLYKATATKQSNGTTIETESLIRSYQVRVQELTDEVSASIYGAKVSKTIRLSSIKYQLETYLSLKMSPTSDNVTQYFVKYGSRRYKIADVKQHWIDVEMA